MKILNKESKPIIAKIERGIWKIKESESAKQERLQNLLINTLGHWGWANNNKKKKWLLLWFLGV